MEQEHQEPQELKLNNFYEILLKSTILEHLKETYPLWHL